MSQGPSDRRRARVEAYFAHFCDTQVLRADTALHGVIEAYCATGLSGRTSATKGTYRSVLRREAGIVLPTRRPRYRGAPAKAPYSPSERAALVAICRAQPRRWRGEAALVVVALGIAAGLRAGEMVALRGRDVAIGPLGVCVSITGTRARTVRVESRFTQVIADAATRVGDGHLVHPGGATRSYPNFVNGICASLVADPGAPRLSVARLRSSYICDRLEAGTALAALLEATGICEVESLLRYARYVEGAPSTKGGLRRALAEGR